MISGSALINKEPPILKVTKTVGLISDTHIPKRALCLPKKVLETFEKVDYIIHAGDIVELSVIDELEQIAPVLAVQGNMDGLEVTNILPKCNMLKVFDWKIGVMHDPDIFCGFNKMKEIANQNGFDIFVYGHTHAADIKWEGKTLFINPGSPTVPASVLGQPSVGILTLTEKTVIPQIINL